MYIKNRINVELYPYKAQYMYNLSVFISQPRGKLTSLE
jgi:hypothetical protein